MKFKKENNLPNSKSRVNDESGSLLDDDDRVGEPLSDPLNDPLRHPLRDPLSDSQKPKRFKGSDGLESMGPMDGSTLLSNTTHVSSPPHSGTTPDLSSQQKHNLLKQEVPGIPT